jgi:hypothetical protein
MIVRLTETQVALAEVVGKARQMAATARGLKDAHGLDPREGLRRHIQGAAGEVAVAVTLNIFWDGNIGGEFRTRDVGPYDVKTTARDDGDLTLYRVDRPDRIHLLVTGGIPVLRLAGWIHGVEALREERWIKPDWARAFAYRTPQAELFPWPPPPDRFFEARLRANS